jgi:hypothetical protein
LATRLPQRPTDSFVDSLIPSISALLIAMLSFVALYAYVGRGLHERKGLEDKLIKLDQLLALRRLTVLSNYVQMRDARTRDLPQFFSDASSEALDRNLDEFNREENSKPLAASKFDSTLIPNSTIAVDLPMRMSVNGTCDVLVTQLAPGEIFHVVTWAVVGSNYAVGNDRAKLASFYSCLPTLGREIQVLIFTLDDGQYAFAIPISLEEDFLGFKKPPGITSFEVENATRISNLVPDALKP